MNKSLSQRVYEKGFDPNHVCDLGVYKPETSIIYEYLGICVKCTLVESDQQSIVQIKEHIKDRENITLHEVAVFDKNCDLELVKRDASTFVNGIESSPSLINDYAREYEDEKVTVKAVRFDEIDDGTIDMLSVDTEGCEWFVIEYMTSRLTVISLETHGGMYINPNIDKISKWLNKNGYIRYYLTSSDTVYVLKDKTIFRWLINCP